MIWGRIVDFVQIKNQHAGTITLDKLPDDIIELFKQKPNFEKMPEDLKSIKTREEVNWLSHPHRYELALVVLLGGWDEKNSNDNTVISKLLGISYEKWIAKARDILNQPNSPLKLKNGIWTVTRKEELLNLLGSQILDANLDLFKDVATEVLREQNPAFELPEDQRYAANVYGKVFKYSGILRQGIAEGVALLGSQSKKLTQCSLSNPQTTALLIVRELLNEAPWQQWASINSLLPDLAEAAPAEFLRQIEKALLQTPCVFDSIFAIEGNGLTGSNYLTGLLWALEGLAWEEQYLVSVCGVLAELATHDPGGRWDNRPINSIITILLPWLPQTLASLDKRNAAVKTIVKDTPDIGWKLLLKLLPGQHQTTSDSHKPKWRKVIPDSWEKGVSQNEYWNQSTFYAELVVEIAKEKFELLAEIADLLDALTQPAFNNFIEHLSSSNFQEISDDSKRIVWEKLNLFTLKHRKFPDAEWALSPELLDRIEEASEKLKPAGKFYCYQYLFSDKNYDLLEHEGNWEEQQKKTEKKRQEAINTLLSEEGFDRLVDFVDAVLSPGEVGSALGSIANNNIDEKLLPNFINVDNQKRRSFIAAYLWRRRYLQGWEWADNLEKSTWTSQQIGQFLSYLPFEPQAWKRATAWLKGAEINYWEKTPADGYEFDEEHYIAVEKLIQYGRPKAALNCISRMRLFKKTVDSNQCIRALMAGINSNESAHTMEQHNVIELIKHLQSDTSIDEADMFKIEWAYLPLLDGYNDAKPTLLEHRLANDPDFFCELIRIIFRSKNDVSSNKELSNAKKAIARNASNLLRNWSKTPGTDKNGHFNSEVFNVWLTRVKEECRKSGHYEIAMFSIGKVLICAPEDENGLWIHRDIAEALNDKEAEDMRRGYSTGVLNSRGVHMVDPSGKPEKKLAQKYRQKADAVENASFRRLSVTLRELADSYDRQAERIISDYSNIAN